MRAHPHVPETRREFLREKRRELRKIKKAMSDIHCGCAMPGAFDGTMAFADAVRDADNAILQMDRITNACLYGKKGKQS